MARSKKPEPIGYRVRITRAGMRPNLPAFEVESTDRAVLAGEIRDRALPYVGGDCNVQVGEALDQDDVTFQDEGRPRRKVLVATINGGRAGFARFTPIYPDAQEPSK